MNGLVAAFDGVLYLSKSLLHHPVVSMLWLELPKLLPGKEGVLQVVSEVTIVSKI